MWFRSLCDSLSAASTIDRSSRRTSHRSIRPHFSSRRLQPCLEVLEERTLPTVFNVGPGDVAALIADINTANTNGQISNTINLSDSVYNLTAINNYWYGPDGLPPISSNLTIHGNGATIQRDTTASTPYFRLFYISGGLELPRGSLLMDNVTLQHGIARGGDSEFGGGGLGAGGAIFNQGGLDLLDVTLYYNEAIGGSSGITATNSFAGGGMGGNASNDNSGGFGGSLGGTFGGAGGAGTFGLGGGGGGFVTGANGADGRAGGAGGGYGDFGSGGNDGGYGGGNTNGADGFGNGGSFGQGGSSGDGGGGGGGVGGGGGSFSNRPDNDNIGAGGGFGGGGSAATDVGGKGGFGGGGGGALATGGTSGSTGPFGGEGGDYSGNFGGGGGGAGLGGAIFNMGADSQDFGSGQMTLINCTLNGNQAHGGDSAIPAPFAAGSPGSGEGGAIFNLDGRVELDSDTVFGNANFGGSDGKGTIGPAYVEGVVNSSFGHDINTGGPVAATLVLNNSILASSGSTFALANSGSVGTATVSGSHNLVTTHLGSVGAGVITLTADPKLGGLKNYGGLTPTLLPLAGSPVLGAGDPSHAPATDQRGVPRPPNGPIDLGTVQVSVAVSSGGSSSGGRSSSAPPAPPVLEVPPLLAFLNSILGGIETVNGNGTETVTDSIFGIPLVVSTFDTTGHLMTVTLFGFNITFMFG